VQIQLLLKKDERNPSNKLWFFYCQEILLKKLCFKKSIFKKKHRFGIETGGEMFVGTNRLFAHPMSTITHSRKTTYSEMEQMMKCSLETYTGFQPTDYDDDEDDDSEGRGPV